METFSSTSTIPESFLEHRQSFRNAWVDLWVLPNPFISPLYHSSRDLGIQLTDFSFSKDATSVGETFLTLAIRKLNATVKIGLDSIVFSAANPDWVVSSDLVSAFNRIAQEVRPIIGAVPAFQETTLALHVVSESVDFRSSTTALVNKQRLGEAAFYGVSIHRPTGSLMIDKSLRYENAAFIRLQQRFSGDASFAEVASKLYEEEVTALQLLGLIDESGETK